MALLWTCSSRSMSFTPVEVSFLCLPSGQTHAHRAAAVRMLTSQPCGTATLAAFAILLGCRAGHSGSQKPEEAVITGFASIEATLIPPGRTAAAEATTGCDRLASSSLPHSRAQVALTLLLLWPCTCKSNECFIFWTATMLSQ